MGSKITHVYTPLGAVIILLLLLQVAVTYDQSGDSVIGGRREVIVGKEERGSDFLFTYFLGTECPLIAALPLPVGRKRGAKSSLHVLLQTSSFSCRADDYHGSAESRALRG
jgi:hypothetical protein